MSRRKLGIRGAAPLAFLVTALACGLSPALDASTVAAQAASDPRRELHDGINVERRASRLGLMVQAEDLRLIAQHHTEEMVRKQRLEHNDRLAYEVKGSVRFAENIGTAASGTNMHRAFMGSDGHKANILDPGFSEVGIGVVWSRGTLWVTQVFRQPVVHYMAPQPAPVAPSPQPVAPSPSPPPPTVPPPPQAPPVVLVPPPLPDLAVLEETPAPPPEPLVPEVLLPNDEGVRAGLASDTGERRLHPLLTVMVFVAVLTVLVLASRNALRRARPSNI